MTGLKFDEDKPMMVLVPPAALKEVAKVATFGAKKYGAANYLEGLELSRMLSAVYRHINSVTLGEDTDPESGVDHLAHAALGLMMAVELRALGRIVDDRHEAYKRS